MTREDIIELLTLCETADANAREGIVEHPPGSMTSEEARMILEVQKQIQQSYEQGNRPSRITLYPKINTFLQKQGHKRGKALREEIHTIFYAVLFFENQWWESRVIFTRTRRTKSASA